MDKLGRICAQMVMEWVVAPVPSFQLSLYCIVVLLLLLLVIFSNVTSVLRLVAMFVIIYKVLVKSLCTA